MLKDTVHVDNIEVGYVGLVKNQCTNIHHLRKIMFARILDEDHIGLNCSNQGVSYKVATSSGFNEVRTDDFRRGIDLCEKINGEKIIYPVEKSMELDSNTVDGDIIIFRTIEMGPFLRYIGFPLQLDRRNLKKVQKILLEPDFPIKRQSTSVELDSLINQLDFNQVNKLKEIIEPFGKLKADGVSSKVRLEEKFFYKEKKYTSQYK